MLRVSRIDIDDVIFNVSAAMIGYGMIKIPFINNLLKWVDLIQTEKMLFASRTMKNKKIFLIPISMFVLGAMLGIISKLLDIYTSNLGNMFSQLSIWILIGTVIAIFSSTKTKAAINVFVFCIGMLITYYITAELSQSVYGMTFIYGWAAFSLCSPIFAWFTWMTKENGIFSKIISVGILLVTLLASFVVFRGPRGYDFIILLALAYFLFIHKVKRTGR